MFIKKEKDPERLLPCPALSTSAKNLEATKNKALWNSYLGGEARDRDLGWRYEWKATGAGRRKKNTKPVCHKTFIRWAI